MEVRFTVLQSFPWIDERGHLMGHYVEGQNYTAREGRQWDRLRAQLPEWEAAGMIEITDKPASEIQGKE